ncbi:831_t:CDS:2, partial [Acaulospora morrowiae]
QSALEKTSLVMPYEQTNIQPDENDTDRNRYQEDDDTSEDERKLTKLMPKHAKETDRLLSKLSYRHSASSIWLLKHSMNQNHRKIMRTKRALEQQSDGVFDEELHEIIKKEVKSLQVLTSWLLTKSRKFSRYPPKTVKTNNIREWTQCMRGLQAYFGEITTTNNPSYKDTSQQANNDLSEKKSEKIRKWSY